jgi:hypothetical protein
MKKVWIVRVVLTVIAAMIVSFCVMCFVVLHFVRGPRLTPLPFDSQVWLTSENDMKYPAPRLRMFSDPPSRDVLRGKTRDEIIAMLGEPDTRGRLRESDMTYQLSWQHRGIDSYWLLIRLDESGVVTEASLTTD